MLTPYLRKEVGMLNRKQQQKVLDLFKGSENDKPSDDQILIANKILLSEALNRILEQKNIYTVIGCRISIANIITESQMNVKSLDRNSAWYKQFMDSIRQHESDRKKKLILKALKFIQSDLMSYAANPNFELTQAYLLNVAGITKNQCRSFDQFLKELSPEISKIKGEIRKLKKEFTRSANKATKLAKIK
jgi:hypothetical protein